MILPFVQTLLAVALFGRPAEDELPRPFFGLALTSTSSSSDSSAGSGSTSSSGSSF